MIEFFANLFGTDFMPHGFCLRSPELIWLNAVCDGLIAVAYFLIPVGLMRLVYKRKDLVYHWLFTLFAIFIVSCGATHVLSIVTLWYPIYRADLLAKAITSIASISTAVLLIQWLPKIAMLPSPEQWRRSNEELKTEINHRKSVEAAMRSLNMELEQRVEERTRELEEQNTILQDLRAAWDLSHGFIRDMDGRINFWCQGAEQLYGFDKEEAIGKVSHQLLKTEFPMPLPQIESELERFGSWSGELIHTAKSGSKLCVATHWVLRRKPKTGSIAVIEVNNDMSDRLRAEEASRRLADIVESSKDAIIGSTLEGVITSWNGSAETLFGYSFREMVGQSVHVLTPPERQDQELKIFNEAGGSDGAKRYETVRLARDGRSIDVSITVSPIRNSAGRVIGVSMNLQDISESKAQEEAIRQSEERERVAVEAGQVGLWYADMQSGRVIWTARCKELHGIKPDCGVPDYPALLSLIHPDDREAIAQAVEKTMNGAELFVEYRTKGLDFRTKWIQSRGRAQRDADGSVRGIHGAVIDLTARRNMEDKLRRVNSELEQFTYAAAHDLQEPLRNVALAADLLSSNPSQQVMDEREPRLLDVVMRNSRRMEAMVKGLLAYSQSIEGEANPLENTNTDVVIDTALQNLSATIRQKAATITRAPLPSVAMKPNHLRVIFENLISNALTHSRNDLPPTIELGGKARSKDILLFVKDNGRGIPSQFHNRAFGMFKRLHPESANGTGIGLAVCKRIVEHYGGEIWIESELGQGATFLFTVPCVEHH